MAVKQTLHDDKRPVFSQQQVNSGFFFRHDAWMIFGSHENRNNCYSAWSPVKNTWESVLVLSLSLSLSLSLVAETCWNILRQECWDMWENYLIKNWFYYTIANEISSDLDTTSLRRDSLARAPSEKKRSEKVFKKRQRRCSAFAGVVKK